MNNGTHPPSILKDTEGKLLVVTSCKKIYRVSFTDPADLIEHHWKKRSLHGNDLSMAAKLAGQQLLLSWNAYLVKRLIVCLCQRKISCAS